MYYHIGSPGLRYRTTEIKGNFANSVLDSKKRLVLFSCLALWLPVNFLLSLSLTEAKLDRNLPLGPRSFVNSRSESREKNSKPYLLIRHFHFKSRYSICAALPIIGKE